MRKSSTQFKRRENRHTCIKILSFDKINEEIQAIFDKLFHPNSNHHVLICKPHEYILASNKKIILDHVHLYHVRKKEIIKNISTYLESIGSLLRPDHIQRSMFGESPIPFLKINSKTYEYNECWEILEYFSDIKIHLEDAHRIHQSTKANEYWTLCTT